MRNTRSHGILMGIGLLGVGTVLGLSQPVTAQSSRDVRDARRDVEKARREVKKEQKDVRQADTPRERREEKGELREAKQDLRREQQELQRERQQRERQGYRAPNYRPQPYYQGRPYYGQNRPYYQDRPYYYEDRPYYQNRPDYRSDPYYQDRYGQSRPYGQDRDFRTLEGTITDDLKGDSFVLRTSYGDRVRVYLDNEPDRLDPGDYVRVYGYFSNGNFRAQSFTILRNR